MLAQELCQIKAVGFEVCNVLVFGFSLRKLRGLRVSAVKNTLTAETGERLRREFKLGHYRV
jgi:hypothetical protein